MYVVFFGRTPHLAGLANFLPYGTLRAHDDCAELLNSLTARSASALSLIMKLLTSRNIIKRLG